jgi:hypothetical protein
VQCPTITDQFFPALDTWTFYGSAYTSRYLTFVPVETRSNVLVSRNANPLEKNSYTALQRLTPAQQAIFAKYDNLRAVPFADFGNRYALTGSSFDPTVLEHETWSQIAAELRNPHGIRGRSILGTVNYITAAICQLTNDQPATACTPGRQIPAPRRLKPAASLSSRRRAQPFPPPPRRPQPFPSGRAAPNHSRPRRVVQCDGRCEEGP